MSDWELGRETRIFNGTLRKLRESRGLTQAQLGKILGIDKGVVGGWENLRRRPNKSQAEKLSAFFQLPIEDICPEFLDVFKEHTTKTIEYAPLTENLLAEAEEERRLLGEIEDDPTKIAEDKILGEQLRAIIKEVLTPREQKVLTMRFGLDGNPPMYLEEVGNFFGVHRETIRQIEKKALSKLRKRPTIQALAERSVNDGQR